MKRLYFFTAILLMAMNFSFGQDTSIYKVKDEQWTDGAYDYSSFSYKNMNLYISEDMVYVYDIEDYYKSGRSFSSNRAHVSIIATNGGISREPNKGFLIDFAKLDEGDTIDVVQFEVDSMNGAAFFERVTYIGSKRPTSLTTESISFYNDLVVYPNPVFDKAYIKGVEEPLSYILYNLAGEAIIGGSISSNAIELDYIMPGNYILRVMTQNESYTTKILKK